MSASNSWSSKTLGPQKQKETSDESEWSFGLRQIQIPSKNSQTFSIEKGTDAWISSIQLLSCVRLFATPWIAACQASLSVTNSRSSLRLMSIESVMPLSHLILCHPLLLLPPIPPSIRVFSNQSTLSMRWPKYWSFSFSIIPSKEIPVLISFRMDWLDLLAIQVTLKSLLQHHSSKASILRCSAFFTVQLSHPYMTTRKTIALTRQTFVGKVMSLLFNMLSRLVITFPPKSKHLLILWLQSPSAVILEPPKIKSDTVSTVSPSISHEVMGPDAMMFVFWMLSFKPTFPLSSFTFIKRLFIQRPKCSLKLEKIDTWDSKLCMMGQFLTHYFINSHQYPHTVVSCFSCGYTKVSFHKVKWIIWVFGREISWYFHYLPIFPESSWFYFQIRKKYSVEYWEEKWQPTPIFLPGESHGRRSLGGYSPRGRKESDTTERLHSLTQWSARQINWLVWLLGKWELVKGICLSSPHNHNSTLPADTHFNVTFGRENRKGGV